MPYVMCRKIVKTGEKLVVYTTLNIIRPYEMHEEQTIAINDPVGWMSVSQSVCHMSEGPF